MAFLLIPICRRSIRCGYRASLGACRPGTALLVLELSLLSVGAAGFAEIMLVNIRILSMTAIQFAQLVFQQFDLPKSIKPVKFTNPFDGYILHF